MRSQHIEETTLELSEVDLGPALEDADPRYRDFFRILVYTESTLDACLSSATTGVVDGAYVRTLWAAYKTGVAVLRHPDHEAIRADFDALETDLRRELRQSVAYVGSHFGIDLEIPATEADYTHPPDVDGSEVVSDG